MINPKDIDFTNPESIKNLPESFLKEMEDNRDPSEIQKDAKTKVGKDGK